MTSHDRPLSDNGRNDGSVRLVPKASSMLEIEPSWIPMQAKGSPQQQQQQEFVSTNLKDVNSSHAGLEGSSVDEHAPRPIERPSSLQENSGHHFTPKHLKKKQIRNKHAAQENDEGSDSAGEHHISNSGRHSTHKKSKHHTKNSRGLHKVGGGDKGQKRAEGDEEAKDKEEGDKDDKTANVEKGHQWKDKKGEHYVSEPLNHTDDHDHDHGDHDSHCDDLHSGVQLYRVNSFGNIDHDYTKGLDGSNKHIVEGGSGVSLGSSSHRAGSDHSQDSLHEDDGNHHRDGDNHGKGNDENYHSGHGDGDLPCADGEGYHRCGNNEDGSAYHHESGRDLAAGVVLAKN